MSDIKIGTRWQGSESTVFTVLHRIELEGNWWIHYRDNNAKEYSCYEQAFLYRFTQILD